MPILKNAIRNASGLKPSLFIPERAFELLMTKQIELLRSPCHLAAEMVLEELMRLVKVIDVKDLSRFRTLKLKVVDISNETLRQAVKPAHAMIESLIENELAYVNTNHPDFVGGNLLGKPIEINKEAEAQYTNPPPPPKDSKKTTGFFGSIFGSNQTTTTTSTTTTSNTISEAQFTTDYSQRDKSQIELIKKLITSYFLICKKNLQDSVIKTTIHFITNAKKKVQEDLVAQLYKEDLFAKLLEEDPTVAAKRITAAANLDTLRKAKKVLQEVEIVEL